MKILKKIIIQEKVAHIEDQKDDLIKGNEEFLRKKTKRSEQARLGSVL